MISPALKKAGHQPIVLEQSSEIKEVGAGIQIVCLFSRWKLPLILKDNMIGAQCGAYSGQT